MQRYETPTVELTSAGSYLSGELLLGAVQLSRECIKVSSYTVVPVIENNNSIIIPAPPTANPGYATSLFFVTSDVPANPAPTISSMVTSSYVNMIFEVSEILSKVFSYSLSSSSALYRKFANEPSTDLSVCKASICDRYLCR